MRHFLFLFYLLFAKTCIASDIQVKISDGVDSDMLKTKMENTIAKILNKVNDAQAQNRDLNFHTMGVNESVSRSLAMLWENTPFICSDELIVEQFHIHLTFFHFVFLVSYIEPSGTYNYVVTDRDARHQPLEGTVEITDKDLVIPLRFNTGYTQGYLAEKAEKKQRRKEAWNEFWSNVKVSDSSNSSSSYSRSNYSTSNQWNSQTRSYNNTTQPPSTRYTNTSYQNQQTRTYNSTQSQQPTSSSSAYQNQSTRTNNSVNQQPIRSTTSPTTRTYNSPSQHSTRNINNSSSYNQTTRTYNNTVRQQQTRSTKANGVGTIRTGNNFGRSTGRIIRNGRR